MIPENGAGPGSAATDHEAQKVVTADKRTSKAEAFKVQGQRSPEDKALFSQFLANAIRAAVLRARLDINELTSVGVALSSGWISADAAIEWLAEIGLCSQVVAVIEGDERP